MGRIILKNVKHKPRSKKYKNNMVMTTKEKIEMTKDVLNSSKVKKIKKDKGLIERTENSVTVLTEDNRELLKD